MIIYVYQHHKVDGMRGFMISAGMASSFASFLCSQTVGTGPATETASGGLDHSTVWSDSWPSLGSLPMLRSLERSRRCNRTNIDFT